MLARLLPLLLVAPLFASARTLPDITRFDGVYARTSFSGSEVINGTVKPAEDTVGSLLNDQCPQTLYVKGNSAASKSSERIIAYASSPVQNPVAAEDKIYDINETYSSCKGYGVIACIASKTILDDYVKSKYRTNDYQISNQSKSNHGEGHSVSMAQTQNGLALKSSFARATFGPAGYSMTFSASFTCQYNKIQ